MTLRTLAAAAALTLLCASAATGCGKNATGHPVAASSPKSTGTTTSTPTTTTGPSTPVDSVGKHDTIVTGAEAEPLMARIRATDPCSMLDTEPLKSMNLGAKSATREGPGLAGCQLRVGDHVGEPASKDGLYLFELSLGEVYDDADRAQDKAETVNGRTIYRSHLADDPTFADTCYYYVPAGHTGYAHRMRLRKVPADGAPDKTPWLEKCDVAKSYVSKIVDRLDSLTPRDKPADGRVLYSKNPCTATDAVKAQYSDWTLNSTSWIAPYRCQLNFTQPGAKYTLQVDLEYRMDTEQKASSGPGNGPYQAAGLSGIILRSNVYGPGPSRCAVSLTYRPSSDGRLNGHLIRLAVDWTAVPLAQYGDPDHPSDGSWPPLPSDACANIDNLSAAAVRAAG
ncbi:DUF3558 family protein [Nocardia sp. NPDC050412]|uniref:DUF3558 family protein n=1 Tax=Nocardia sp. NPDC050412 TaxID=3364320 RepID=UPI00378DE972